MHYVNVNQFVLQPEIATINAKITLSVHNKQCIYKWTMFMAYDVQQTVKLKILSAGHELHEKLTKNRMIWTVWVRNRKAFCYSCHNKLVWSVIMQTIFISMFASIPKTFILLFNRKLLNCLQISCQSCFLMLWLWFYRWKKISLRFAVPHFEIDMYFVRLKLILNISSFENKWQDHLIIWFLNRIRWRTHLMSGR